MMKTKQFFALLMAIVTLISITACSNGAQDADASITPAPTPEVTIVELTPSNIKDYFEFKADYENFDYHVTNGIYFMDADIRIDVYQTVTGNLTNVKVKLKIEFDYFYNRAHDSTLIIDIAVPSDGKYTMIQDISCVYTSVKKPSTPCKITVLEASGEITIK